MIGMENKKYPEPVEALLLVLFTLGLILVTGFILVGWMLLFRSPTTLYTKLIFVLDGIPFLIIPLIYVKIRKYDAGTLFRFKPVKVNVLTLSILIGLSLGVIGDELDRLIQIFLPIPSWFIDQLKFMRAETAGDWTLLLLGVVFLAAFSEELLFRGFLQVSLERKGDPTRAVLLTSLTWTLVHVNPYWAVQIFIIGVVIGFLAWRTNSIVPTIMVHGINNFLSLIFYNCGDHLNWYLTGNHVSVYILIPAAFLLVWSIRQLTDIYRPVS
jgi:membrane protease YdiL (CAAX protease family)